MSQEHPKRVTPEMLACVDELKQQAADAARLIAEIAPTVTMLPRPELAHRFAVRKARDLIAQEDEQQIGDASDGCGEGPGGETE